MNIERYRPDGRCDITYGVSSAAADRIYRANIPMVITPFEKYDRIRLVREDGWVVRDTEHEIYGIQSLPPRPPYDKSFTEHA